MNCPMKQTAHAAFSILFQVNGHSSIWQQCQIDKNKSPPTPLPVLVYSHITMTDSIKTLLCVVPYLLDLKVYF